MTSLLTPHDPNFPTNLQIKASTSKVLQFDFTKRDELNDSTGKGKGKDVLGDEDERMRDRDELELDASIEQDIEKYGIAGRTWEAAYLMKHYLTPPDPSTSSNRLIEFDPICPLFSSTPTSTRRRNIIEIGSGTGYLPKHLRPFLSSEKERLIVTDLEEVCPLLEKNLRPNRRDFGQESSASETVEILVRLLPWGDRKHFMKLQDELGKGSGEDVILASDLVYFPFLYPALLRTLIWLTQDARGKKIIIGYKIRSLVREEPFWKAFGVWFEYEPVHYRTLSSKDAHTEGWQRFGQTTTGEDQLFIFVGIRRADSFDWTIPEDDEVLMNSLGSDDQFERLLMLGMEW